MSILSHVLLQQHCFNGKVRNDEIVGLITTLGHRKKPYQVINHNFQEDDYSTL